MGPGNWVSFQLARNYGSLDENPQYGLLAVPLNSFLCEPHKGHVTVATQQEPALVKNNLFYSCDTLGLACTPHTPDPGPTAFPTAY